MTKAFDTALFVPPEPPDVGQASGITVTGPPYDTDWYYYVIADGPGVTMGASIPAATSAGQTIRSGPAPGFPWEAVPPYYLGALSAPPSTNVAPGSPPLPLPGTMYYNTTDSTPYILAANQTDWIPLPVATANRLTIAASLPAAMQQGQTLVSGPNVGGGFPWVAQQSMFLGAHPTPPTTAGGAPIPVGSVYYNTTNGKVYVWDGTGWRAITSPAKAFTLSLCYVGASGQTIFPLTTNDIFGQNHTFDQTTNEGIEVYANGVRMLPDGAAPVGDYTVDYVNSIVTMTTGVSAPTLVTIDVLVDERSLSPTLVLIEMLQPLAFDGVTTTFPLIVASSGTGVITDDPANLMVHLDGVMQQPGVDYVLDAAGGSIIFAVPPNPDVQNFIILFAKSKIGFLSRVDHDGTMTGDGTATNPLSVVPATTVQRGAVFVPGLTDVPPSPLTINPLNGKLGMTVALQTQIQAGTDNVQPVTPLTLRGVMGAPVSSLTTTAKTVVPAINELVAGQKYRGIWQVAANNPNLTPPLVGAISGWVWVATTTNPQVAEVAPAGIAGIVGQSVDSGDFIVWNGANYSIVRGSSVNRAQADALYVNVTGDTMTGPLIQAADPVNPLGTATKQYVDAADALRVLKAGDTMTGPLIQAADPVQLLGTATKQYVDSSIANQVLYHGTWQVATNVPDIRVPPTAPLNGYSWTAQTANPSVPEVGPAGIPGVTGQTINSGDVIQWNTAGSTYQIVTGSSLSIIQADARFVNITGDTMTGAFTLAADPAAPLQAATKQYVDNNDLLNVKKTGDTMTGQLVTIAPVAPGDATNKAYVDAADALNVKKTGDIMTGQLTTIAPVAAGDAANKGYVDTADALNVKKAGDTMSGALVIGPHLAGFGGALVLDHTTLVNNPNAIVGKTGGLNRWSMYLGSNQAETGANAGSNFALYRWNDAGGGPNQVLGFDRDTGRQTAVINSTGNITLVTPAVLTLAADPAAALQAATKQYVDNAIASSNLFQGNWQVAANIPDLTPAVANPQNGYQWTAQTVDPLIPETALASLPGIGGQLINNGDKITWSTVGSTYNVIPAGGMTQAQADTRYLQLTGGALTGYLTLNADPTVPTGAATKNYVDTLSANAVQKTGDTMTGNLNLPLVDPTQPAEATNKQYVDQTIANNALYQGIYTILTNVPDLRIPPNVPLNGYSWIAQTTDPTLPDNTVVALPGIPLGTPIDGGWTIRYNGNTSLYEVIKGPNISLTAAGALFVDVAGDTMTGNLTFNGTNLGVNFTGGSGIYSWTDKGLTLREGTNGTQPRIIDNNGANARDIVDTLTFDTLIQPYLVPFARGRVADVQPNEQQPNGAYVTVNITGLPPSSTRRFMWVLTPQFYAAGASTRSYKIDVPGSSTGGRAYLVTTGAGPYAGTTFTVFGSGTTDSAGAVSMTVNVTLDGGTAMTWLGSGGGISQRSRVQVFDMGTR